MMKGYAYSRSDRAIVLYLYMGDLKLRLVYEEWHPDYRKIKDSIGPLERGQEKPIQIAAPIPTQVPRTFAYT